MTKTLTIKVTAPEDYDDVCDQIALDDFVGQPKGFGVELLLNVRGECCLCAGEWEDIHLKFDQKKAEIEALHTKLEKAEASRAELDSVLYFASLIADTPRGTEHLLLANEVTVHGPDIYKLMLALREYRGEETK